MTRIDINGVLEVFAALSNSQEISERDAVLCEGARSSVENILKNDADLPANMKRLCYAAACKALYRRAISENAADNLTSFSVGDVDIKLGREAEQAAKELYLGAMRDISDLVVPKRFKFRGV